MFTYEKSFVDAAPFLSAPPSTLAMMSLLWLLQKVGGATVVGRVGKQIDEAAEKNLSPSSLPYFSADGQKKSLHTFFSFESFSYFFHWLARKKRRGRPH